MTAQRQDDDLWAITCYFNPMGYRRRLENFRVFRSRLIVPLVAVEVTYDGMFQLRQTDAEVVVRCWDADILWQKERLLNLALLSLPPECKLVAWLDCDIVFLDEQWPAECETLLREYPLVQLFRRILDLGEGQGVPVAGTAKRMRGRLGLAFGVHSGAIPDAVFRTTGASLRLGYSPGHAWAARRDILQHMCLYDALILGSGDKGLAAAAYGQIEQVTEALALNQPQTEHYRAWAEGFWRAVRGRVGWCGSTLAHLWHGELALRLYGARYQGLHNFHFDPAEDLAIGRDGCWRWATRKIAMHEYVRDYFALRREDG